MRSAIAPLSGYDIPRMDVWDKLQAHAKLGYPIALVSSRSEEYRRLTESRLRRAFDPRFYEVLLMRHAHDKRPDTDEARHL